MIKWILGLSLAAVFGAGSVLGVIKWRNTQDESPSRYMRGKKIAEDLGCFACHGPDGKGGTNNYLPDLDEIPGWHHGAFKAYVKNPDEVAEWILEGMPERMRKDPAEHDRVSKQLIKMPAYKGKINEADLDSLITYLLGVSTLLPLDEETPVGRGRAVATRMGCFGCHGGEGRARPPNPGSLKGYIPAWDSEDYEELVKGPGEFKEWVLKGAPDRLFKNPAAKFFITRQTVRMPAYEGKIQPDELEDLSAYVDFVRSRR